MFDLTRQEKIILLFLALSFFIGLGINVYKKSQPGLELKVQPYQLARLAAVDKIIDEDNQLNINSLESDQLTRLPGIGPKIAQRIVQYRQAHGPFRSKEELMQVKGIGKKKFEEIRDAIVLE